jgi:hypothetical protein
MERIHRNICTEIIHRLRAKDCKQSISRDLCISCRTLHKYRLKPLLEGYLDTPRTLPGREFGDISLGSTP